MTLVDAVRSASADQGLWVWWDGPVWGRRQGGAGALCSWPRSRMTPPVGCLAC